MPIIAQLLNLEIPCQACFHCIYAHSAAASTAKPHQSFAEACLHLEGLRLEKANCAECMLHHVVVNCPLACQLQSSGTNLKMGLDSSHATCGWK